MLRALVQMFGFVVRRRWLRRLICFLVLAPLCLFLASNIFLNSGWVKGKIAAKLEARTGVPWEVGTVNWTPDGRVHVYDARAALGEGELTLERIDIEPMIREGLRGDLRFREVVVGRPKLVVGLDWIESEMAKRVQEPKVVQPKPPVVAKVDPTVGKLPKGKPSGGGKSQGGGKPMEPVKPDGGGKPVRPERPDVAKQPEKVEPKPVEKVVEEVAEELPSWLKIEGAEVVLMDGGRTVLELRGVDAEVPLGGEGLAGFLNLEGLLVGGENVLGERRVEFERKRGVLVCGVRGGEFYGVDYDFLMEVKLVGREAYFLAKGLVRPQDVVVDQKVEGTAFDFGAKGLSGEGLLEGNLLRPTSWRGGLVCMAERVHFGEHHREGAWDFERMNFSGRLERGVFMAPRFGMWSEDLAVMGNGYSTLNGNVTGVVRMMGSPESMQWFTGIKNGVGLFRGRRHSLVSQWENPDRQYVDFRFSGPVRSLEWKAEKVSDWEPFWPDLHRMKDFIKLERLEDIDGVQRN